MTESDDPTPHEEEGHGIGLGGTHLHPLAPVVFVVAGLAIGGVTWLAFGPALGVPLGLFGGGIGVWMLERGRRMLSS